MRVESGVYIYIYMPGSSRYVKFLPFGRFFGVNLGTNFKHKRKIQVCIAGQIIATSHDLTSSFLHRIRKIQQLETIWTDAKKQLQDEWNAISKAKGFSKGFPAWCISMPEVGYFPVESPDEDFLITVIQLLRHKCDCKVADEKSIRKQLSKFAKQQDAKNGLQKAAKEVRAASNSNLAQTTRSIAMPFVKQHSNGGLATITFQQPVNFNLQGIAYCGKQEIKFVDIRGTEADVMIIDADNDLPIQGILEQSQITMEPKMIALDLTHYWNGFWQRENAEETLEETKWTEFVTLMKNVPQLPQITLDIDQIDVWMEVIRNSKSNSARGVDGWYMDEIKTLPPNIIQALIDIFVQHEGQAFSEQDMKVITIPMGKVEIPEKPSQTRPITLLGMLYRLWSKVSSKILLRHLQKSLPESLIGFIPGRSMQLTMLKQQFAFEQLHQNPGSPVHWEGVTLDIVKCFNAIARLPAAMAMELLGIPRSWIQFWKTSLGRTNRFWKIHEQLWEGDFTTTGCPEGDCWSIIACLGLSYIWTSIVTKGTTQPLSFADNWNWRSQDTESNIIAIQDTVRFLNAIKLQIDWNKTWIWCTSSVIKNAWKNRIHDALPEVSIRVVTSARELGYTMHYNRVQNRYTQRERTTDAMKRWKRLQQMQLTIDEKGKVAHWALIKAFFATECYAVGQSWIQKCRTAIAKSLIPNRKNTNPFLATMLLTKHTKDPELYVIMESLRATRHLLWNMNQADQTKFCEHVAKHNRKHSDVYGPAGALAYNLARIGWSLTSQGQISTDTIVSFHIMKDDISTIEKYLEQNWMQHVMRTCISRPAWRNFPAPNRQATLRAFSKIPEFQKRIGSYHLTGSCMMNDQKKHFTDLTESCQLCGKPDNETHRLLECFETNAVRQKYPDIISYLQEHDECSHHLPVEWETNNCEFEWLYFQSRPKIQIDMEVVRQVQSECCQGVPILIFTDGSCNKVQTHFGTLAASAVVCHPGCSIDDQAQIVKHFKTTKNIPSTFRVIGVGECNGPQTITRAELQAVIAIASSNITCDIYTDSQYVLDVAEKIRHLQNPATFHKCRNFDLINEFWYILQAKKITLHKVKAHSFSDTDSDETSFLKIGNMAADLAANTARKSYEARHRAKPSDTNKRNRLTQYFNLLYDLHLARNKWFELNEQATQLPTTHRNSSQWLRELQGWIVETPRQIDEPDNLVQILNTCIWGTEYSLQVYRWLQLLQFPVDTVANDPGISWYEMTVSYLMTTQDGVVINGAGPGEPFQPRKLDKNDTDISFGLQVYSFERCVTQVCRTLKLQVLPKRKKFCTSVKMLGLKNAKAGLENRPIIPQQPKTMSLLYEHFAAIGGDEAHKGGPVIPDTASLIDKQPTGLDEQDRYSAWKERHRRYQQRKSTAK